MMVGFVLTDLGPVVFACPDSPWTVSSLGILVSSEHAAASTPRRLGTQSNIRNCLFFQPILTRV